MPDLIEAFEVWWKTFKGRFILHIRIHVNNKKMWQMKIFHLDILSNKCHKNIFSSIGIILAEPPHSILMGTWVKKRNKRHKWKYKPFWRISECRFICHIYLFIWQHTHIIILWCCPFSVQQVQTREGNSKKMFQLREWNDF